MCYSRDYRMLKEERTKTEAARLAEQRRAEMVEWLLTAAVQDRGEPDRGAGEDRGDAKMSPRPRSRGA